VVEVVRMVADWLRGDTVDVSAASQSVAVHLAAMTYDGSDTAPTAPTIYEETTDAATARGDMPASLPALTVSIAEFDMDPATMVSLEQYGKIRVLVRFVAEQSTTASAMRDGYYVLRAVRRSLERLHRAGEHNNGRYRNSVSLVAGPDPMTLVRFQAPIESPVISAGWIVTYQLRDEDV
jgi:hypothetical protein